MIAKSSYNESDRLAAITYGKKSSIALHNKITPWGSSYGEEKKEVGIRSPQNA
jgi:hypothetical protein